MFQSLRLRVAYRSSALSTHETGQLKERKRSRTPSSSSGVVEQSPLSSCVYSANPTGTVGRGGGGNEGGEKDTRARGREGGREEGKRKNRQSSAAIYLKSFLTCRPENHIRSCSFTRVVKQRSSIYALVEEMLRHLPTLDPEWSLTGDCTGQGADMC
ncbi:hypothetical protein INR49_012683 [Caranx melampygus]|nr:hypothetical protein INR49_012683 [Caranx melampygus]